MKARILSILVLTLMVTLCLVACDETTGHIHEYDEWLTTKKPTCLEDGEQTRHCTCGAVDSRVILAMGHDAGEWVIDIHPTSTQEGSKHQDCTFCGERVKTESIPVFTEELSYRLEGDGTCTILGLGTSAPSVLHIPSKIHEHTVTSIDNFAFAYCTSLTEVSLPDTVTTIGTEAFYACKRLKSIVVPTSVVEIGLGAFAECASLESLTTPFVGATAEETSNTHIGYLFGARNNNNYAYDVWQELNECVPASLKTVVITGGNRIGDGAFAGCTGLTSVTIGNGVTSIGDFAFSGCKGLTSVTIENGVTSIGTFAFYGCKGLTSVTIPNSVTSIDSSAFSSCTGLTSIVIPDSVTSIGGGAFSGCTGLTSVTIPNSVTSIGNSAFYGCTGLTSIVIPDSVTEIGREAFEFCTGLTSIVIPDSVNSIGGAAFYGCTNLTTIYCEAASRPSGWDSGWKYDCAATVVWDHKG